MKTSLGTSGKWRLDHRSSLPLYAQAGQLPRELIQQQCSIVADPSQKDLKVVNAERPLARLLGVHIGTARLRRDRTVLDPGRRPMEFAVVRYRCEPFTLTLKLRQE